MAGSGLSASAKHSQLVQAQIGGNQKGREAGEVALIPRHAMQRGNTLWMVDTDQKLVPREVEVLRRDDDFVYVGEGVAAGETFCLTPVDQPLPGMQVRVSG